MRKLILAAVLVLMASGAQAVTLNVVGGQLMGASNVLVDGSLYDVQFLDGTCIALFHGCDEVSDFTFQTEASALLASQALIDQVFLDGVEGQFDTLPALTNGCPDMSRGDCWAVTPFGFVPGPAAVSASRARNTIDYGGPGWFDTVVGGLFFKTDAFVGDPQRTYALWSAVPEPSTALLLGLGLAGIAARRRV